MAQILGDVIERQDEAGAYLKSSFFPTAMPLQQRWHPQGLSADFLADSLRTFSRGEDGASAERQAEIKRPVSSMANELLENAMKLSHSYA